MKKKLLFLFALAASFGLGFAFNNLATGGPCYARNGIIEAGFSSQKHFIGFYILKQEVFNQFIHELKVVTFGKGVIRFTKPGYIDFTVVKKMIVGTYLSKNIICGHNQQKNKWQQLLI